MESFWLLTFLQPVVAVTTYNNDLLVGVIIITVVMGAGDSRTQRNNDRRDDLEERQALFQPVISHKPV